MMQNTLTLPDMVVNRFYRSIPVNTEQKELRLVTIDPKSTADQLICHLETVSLLDTTQAYNDFLTDQADADIGPSKLIEAWQGLKQSKRFPKEGRYRFSWGDFAALSYVWGDPDDTTSITVNGAEAHVTKNLAFALHSLRETGQFTGRFRLWVDALCINQHNSLERSAQVATMRFFYVRAWLVLGFLGPQTDDSELAIELVEFLASIYGNKEKCDKLRTDLNKQKFDHKPGSWLALNRLLLRPYWERLWIMQELALGGARTELLCGQRQISWMTFGRGVSIIHTDLWVARHEALDVDMRAAYDPWEARQQDATRALDHVHKNLWLLTQVQESLHEQVKFSRLLEMANTSSCLNQRDKVYGMLGLMDFGLANAIVPDYTADVATVFLRAAQAYISTYNNLELLRDANCWGTAGSPTWVPDWTWTGRGYDSRPDDLYQRGKSEAARHPYNASGGLTFVLPEHNDNRLGCHAIIFDFVDGLGSNAEADNPEPVVQSQGSRCAYGSREETALQLAIALYGSRRWWNEHTTSILELPLTMKAAIKQFTDLGWDKFVTDLVHYHRWVAWYNCNASLCIGGRPLREYFSGKLPQGEQEDDHWTAHSGWVRTALAGCRRLITTRQGRIGWVSCASGVDEPGEGVEVQRGDALSIFPGCSTPIVLRPTDTEGVFKVAGEAYVHGVMEGEVSQLLNRDECKLEKIWLV